MKKIGIVGLGNPLQRDKEIDLILLQYVQKQKNSTKKISNILRVEYLE
jgi:hypothetical protein